MDNEPGRQNIYQGFLDLLFPPRCLSCDVRLPYRSNPLFCGDCYTIIDFVREPLCSCCGRHFPKAAGGNHFCSLCLRRKRHYSSARAVVHYNDPMVHPIHSLKYNGKTAGLSSFSVLKKSLHHLKDMEKQDVIIPVPLHKKRLRERGFNQALLLARAFFPNLKNKIKPMLLERHRYTDPQTGMDGAARRKNLKNAFRVKYPDTIKVKNILLIDDVFTTGTTVNECSKTLKRAGAKDIQVLTLARVKED